MREWLRQTQPADHAARQVDGDEVERIHQATQTNTVSASGAMKRRLPWIIDFDWSSTISTSISIAHWKRPGTPDVALRAANAENQDRGEAADDRPEQRVEIPDVDVENRRLRVSGKILQVVRDVLRRIHRARSFASCHNFKATQIVENLSAARVILEPPR